MGINKHIKPFFFMLLASNFIITHVMAAPQDSRATTSDSNHSAYQQYKDRIVAMDLEYKSLKKAYEELNQKYNQLKYENGQLNWKIKELGQWNRQLHEGYGPGIWLMSDAATPEFKYKSQSGKVEEIIKDLNVVFRNKKFPQIILKKLDNHTAVLGLDKPQTLSKQMGASGAANYIQEVLYTVTSADDVECIYLDIPDADIAQAKKSCR